MKAGLSGRSGLAQSYSASSSSTIDSITNSFNQQQSSLLALSQNRPTLVNLNGKSDINNELRNVNIFNSMVETVLYYTVMSTVNASLIIFAVVINQH